MQKPALSFIQNKVSSIGTALFFCDSKTLLPFPAYIITALKTDDEGNIWFFISRSWNQSVTYDVSTPAKLEFYRKGYPFALSVVGLAYLVDDNEKYMTLCKTWLVKVWK